MSPYKLFPPRRGELLVPVGSRAAALAALSLFPACRWQAAAAQRCAWVAVRLAGARLLPGRTRRWVPPLPDATWEGVVTACREALGDWDHVAVLRHVEAGRGGVALLLLRGDRSIAFVKLRPEARSLARERAALEAVAAFDPRSFAAPVPLAAGEVHGWHWLAITALPPRIHRPARASELEPVLAEVEAALEATPRPADVPPHWRPMHGDLTPWNLRRLSRKRLVLVDWESAGWGPPGADRVLFQATEAALGGRAVSPSPDDEAVDYWRRVIQARTTDRRGQLLVAGLERSLARMGARRGAGLLTQAG